MADWFYVESGKAIGPLSRIELEACVRSGRVSPDTLVCEEGGHDWRLARKVPGLVPPKLLKAWQAGVAAEREVVPPTPSPPPRGGPGGSSAARAADAVAPPLPGAPAPPGARASATGLRRHLLLALVIGLAAAGGAVLGAWLVVRRMVPAAPGAVAAAPGEAPSGGVAAASADASRESFEDPTLPEGLRPQVPGAPPPLPENAQRLLEARWSPIRDALAAHARAADGFVTSGGLDAATLRSKEEVDARLVALGELRASNESLRRALSELPEAVRADAAAAGLAPEVADAAARRAKADAAPEMEACEAEAELHDIAGELLGLLGESFGHWSVPEGRREIAFGPGAGDAPARYADLAQQARDVVR